MRSGTPVALVSDPLDEPSQDTFSWTHYRYRGISNNAEIASGLRFLF